MFGVGQNPIYLKRQAQRDERKARSGQAKREAADQEAQRRIDVLFGKLRGEEGVAEGSALDDGEAEDIFGAIFGDYVVQALGNTPASSAPPPAECCGEGVYSFACGSAQDPDAREGGLVAGDAETAAKERLREVLQSEAADGLDPYAVLGLKRDATAADVKRAFRRLAMRWHPDRGARLPEVERLQVRRTVPQGASVPRSHDRRVGDSSRLGTP